MNVVFLVLDTVRRDRISVYNDGVDFTESLDDFAENATVFEDAVAQAPWTLPSHASMFTGLYPWEHEATQRNPGLDIDKKLLAEELSERGYSTGCFTYNTFLSEGSGLTDGFNQVDNFMGSLGSLIPDWFTSKWNLWLSNDSMPRLKAFTQRLGTRIFSSKFSSTSDAEKVLSRSEEFIKNSSGDDFFLFANLMEAHEPYYPPKSYLEKHAPDVDPGSICQDPNRFLDGREEADFDDISKVYDACIDYMDDRLGEFFEFLEDEGLLEDTAVIICSDHGQMLGEKGMYGHWFSVDEPLVRVPLIVRAPEIDEEKIERQVELREIYDIVLTVLEGEKPDLGTEMALGGFEFPDLAIKIITKKRDDLYRRLRFVRGRGKKIVESRTEDGNETYEMTDLGSGEEIEVEEDFREKVKNIEQEVSSGELEAEEEVKERLEKLGYM